MGDKYWKATWFCAFLVVFVQLTGVNAIMFYSNSILQKMETDGKAVLTPTLGTVLIGVINFVGSIFSFLPVKYLSRKFLFCVGEFVMAASLIVLGFSALNSISSLSIVMMMLINFAFSITMGALFWTYVAEVVIDTGLGFCFLVLKGTAVIITLTTELMMESALNSWGVFWMYGGLTSIGFFYFLIFMRETKGLTDKQKKSLYSK